ncbi:MAG: nitrogen fixation negative regulator NifL, partial [Oceanobacter sp.]
QTIRDYALLMITDVTEMRRRQEEVHLNALKALMAEEDLVQGMRETVNGAIHQLQGPVNLLATAVSMLERRNDERDSYLRGALEDALKSGREALASLTGSLPPANEEMKKPVNVNELLREALALSTEPLLMNGITVEWQPSLHLPAVVGQERRLRSMFKQLIINAIEAMSERSVKVRELTIITATEKDGVTIELKDSGPGISAELMVKVFEPFFSTKVGRAGARGMGLPMVQEIANDHSGSVHIDPNYTSGCRFVIHLPLNAAH